MELQRYWSVVRRKWWMIALITLVVCTVSVYYASRMSKPQFEATAKLIVNQIKGPNAQSSTLDAGSISSNIMLIKTYKEIIRNPRVMGKVASQFPELRATAGELGAKVIVGSVNETQVMSVTVRDGSYERAANMANAVSKVFQQEIRTLMNLDNVSVLNWADPSERRGPVSSHPAKNVMIAFVLSMMAGIGLAFILEQLDDTVKSEKDIRTKLGIPLLATIPKMKSKHFDGRRHQAPVANPAGRKQNVTLDA